MSIREGGRSTRVRNRTKPQPAKKTRVNAQRYVVYNKNIIINYNGLHFLNFSLDWPTMQVQVHYIQLYCEHLLEVHVDPPGGGEGEIW